MQTSKIVNSQAGSLLLDMTKARLLTPFMVRPMTLAEAATHAAVKASSLDYWVKRFLELDLLVAVPGTRPQMYQASSSEYLIDVSRTAPLEEIVHQLDKPGQVRVTRAITSAYRRLTDDWYLRLYIDDQQLVRQELVPTPAHYTAGEADALKEKLPLNIYGLVSLSRAQAQTLSVKLQETLMQYFENETNTSVGVSANQETDTYIFHVCLVKDAPPGSN